MDRSKQIEILKLHLADLKQNPPASNEAPSETGRKLTDIAQLNIALGELLIRELELMETH